MIATHFVDHADSTGVRADDRADWLALRKTMVTASDVAAILGEDQHRSALSVYVEKITGQQEPEQIGLDDPRFWGNVLEQPVLRAVAAFYGWEYFAGGALLRSRRHPHLGATLDAEINRGSGWEVMEGKTTRVPRGWDEESGELPVRVLIQTQSQLLVTGADVDVVFALLQGSRPVQIEVHPSPEFHAVIVEETERFMARLARMDPPPPDHTESSQQALARLYPKDVGAGVLLPAEAGDWTREIKEISAQQAKLKKRKAELSNMLRAAIGSATYGILPDALDDGQRAWKHALEHKDSHVVAASSTRALRPIKNLPPIPIATTLGGVTALPPRSVEDLLRASIPTDPASLAAAPHVEARALGRQRRRARR